MEEKKQVARALRHPLCTLQPSVVAGHFARLLSCAMCTASVVFQLSFEAWIKRIVIPLEVPFRHRDHAARRAAPISRKCISR